MGLLTIGVFAREAGLTPKALRLYDELGLLPPAAVDADSGYRLYHPEQLDQARLIAELRRIGMPLAGIRTVRGLPPAEAAGAVAAYWQQVSADLADRGRRADLLVEHLTEGGTTMTDRTPELTVRSAAGCDRGAVREENQDAAYAGDRLLAVADGGGGAGDAAATAALDALRTLEPADVPATGLLARLAGAVTDVDRAVRTLADPDHQPFTTLTAILRRGSQLALVHVGDSRAYLLRGGELVQLTQDHTWVQTQVDAGKLDRDQAAAHPQRAVLVRALGARGHDVEADLALRTALPGDRYLLCSDGLSAVVDRAALLTTLATPEDPRRTVDQLIAQAHAAGAPDNIACVVADFEAA